MKTPDRIAVHVISDEGEMQEAFRIRKIVFVAEQNVPEDEELDEYEGNSRHFLASFDGIPCGTARWRFTASGIKMERFAVLKDFRGKGIGEALVKAVLVDIPRDQKAYLHAQVQVIPFYEKFGFEAVGVEFDECGIWHRVMMIEHNLPD